MDLNLKGKIALISGASAGIGRETTKVLAGEGVRTIAVARRKDLLLALADEIARTGGERPATIVEDLTDRSAFDRVRKRVLDEFKYIDILVNNLGQARPFKVHNNPDADWDEAFGINFTPSRKLADAFLPTMLDQKFGRIINLTATSEPAHVSGSMTSKAALLAWAKGLARSVAGNGITVNCVSPGYLLTEQMTNNVFPRLMPTEKDREEFIKSEIPVGHFGDPRDAANLIAFLASPNSSYITGQRIYVDGGWNRHV